MTLKSVETLLDVLQFADSNHTAVIVPELGNPRELRVAAAAGIVDGERSGFGGNSTR